MRTKYWLIIAIVMLLSSCYAPKYLPDANEIGQNQYGSYIQVSNKTMKNISGELIAIDSTQLIVLENEHKICKAIPLSEVSSFNLRYAKSKNYGWTIPVFTLFSFTHGYFFLFSMPLNLIVTISVTASGQNAFTYSDNDMTFEKLKMFSRFPQSIPPHITLDQIK